MLGEPFWIENCSGSWKAGCSPPNNSREDSAGPQTAGNLRNLNLRLLVVPLKPKLKPGLPGCLWLSLPYAMRINLSRWRGIFWLINKRWGSCTLQIGERLQSSQASPVHTTINPSWAKPRAEPVCRISCIAGDSGFAHSLGCLSCLCPQL